MTLTEHIESYLKRKDWDGLTEMLSSRSNSEKRRSEQVVRTEILPKLDNDMFWSVFRYFVLYRPQGFLPCISSLKHLAMDGSLNFGNEDVAVIARELSKKDINKLVSMAIPQLQNENQIVSLFNVFNFHDPTSCAIALIHSPTPLCYYSLFKLLKMHHDKHDLCLKCCRYLLRQNTDMSFNMASILRAYFGLHEIKSQMSLKIEPYEINYLDKSEDTFYYMLEGKRPVVVV